MTIREVAIPTSETAEEGVLSCLLYNPRHMSKVADTLTAAHFTRDRYALIYRAMLGLHTRGKLVSVTNVTDELARSGQSDDVLPPDRARDSTAVMDYLEDIKGSMASLKATADDYAETIIRTGTMRSLYDAARQIAAKALAQDDDTVEFAEELIYAIALGSGKQQAASLNDVLDRYMSELQTRREQYASGNPTGIPTGYRELDNLLGGLRPSNLYTLAARPGRGKTALALLIALNIVKRAKHALFFSLEMDEAELAERILSSETEIDSAFLRDGDVTDLEYRDVEVRKDNLRDLDLQIDDRTYLLADIRTKARREHARKPLQLIVVDYLQLIDVSPTGREKHVARAEEVAKISKALKRLSRELKVPILALAQMNREIDRRGVEATPQLADLGESSGIEKDSDTVMFLHVDKDEDAKSEKSEPYEVQVIVKKNRKGKKGTARLRFIPAFTRFENSESEESYARPYAE